MCRLFHIFYYIYIKEKSINLSFMTQKTSGESKAAGDLSASNKNKLGSKHQNAIVLKYMG